MEDLYLTIKNNELLSHDYLEEVNKNVNIDEGKQALEKVLVDIYLKEGISTKELARNNLLPVPIITAVKKEFIKRGLVVQDRGVRLTDSGIYFVENKLGFKGLNKALYMKLLSEPWKEHKEISELKAELNEIFINRPDADVTIDQSKCTVDTAVKRAILALINSALIGKRVLCVGDDDFISIAIGFLLKKLYSNIENCNTKICVMDIDERILKYIHALADKGALPIACEHIDFKLSVPSNLKESFDCFFTDPPYTLQGMKLFVSRGIEGLKKQRGIPVFLSFAHKSPDFEFSMQKCFIDMGLKVSEIFLSFNKYEGAGIIGNTGQMIILKTTSSTQALIEGQYNNKIYTGELKRTVRYYKCKKCGEIVKVGAEENVKTVEKLKEIGCEKCNGKIFDIVKTAKDTDAYKFAI